MTNPINPFAVDDSLRNGLTEAIIAQGHVNHRGINAYLRKVLSGRDTNSGALLTEPIVEAAAEYLSSGQTPAAMEGLLHDETRAALEGKEREEHCFDYPAYAHQLKSWTTLSHEQRQSLLVASGTGSGKTECFMVPMLDDLVRESNEKGGATLTGVRALMLYPLNALIASQKERLDAWTRPFGKRLRFGLYNGQMKQGNAYDVGGVMIENPNEALYRKDLYNNPPPILVTNNTMLEYMTIRQTDAPILEASKGKLRWIIVDEAHSYIGSSAAELSLLLRRVLQAFEVEATDVRFVATSATIGDESEEGQAALQKFWADIAGISPEAVDVIFGEREPFVYPKKESAAAKTIASALTNIAADRRDDVARGLAHKLFDTPMPFADINADCGGKGQALLNKFAQGIDPTAGGGQKPLLPMRVHKFLRAVPGLWSCLSPDCSGERPEDWAYGALFHERREKCSHCDALVFEIHSCNDCGEPMLLASERDGMLSAPPPPWQMDEFADPGALGDDVEVENDDDEDRKSSSAGHNRYIACRSIHGIPREGVGFHSGKLTDKQADNGIWIAQYSGYPCLACGAKGKDENGSFWPNRFGMPFLMQNATPMVIDGVSPVREKPEYRLPSDGRQVISFTDSRQGTARIAARIETQSERNFTRAFIYHKVNEEAANNGSDLKELAKIEQEIQQLQSLGFEGIALDNLLKQRDAFSGNTLARVSWEKMADDLSQSSELRNTISKVWDQDRELKFVSEPKRLANFLLLRELARRPLLANTVETMGLARLSFPQIEKLSEANLPEHFRIAGHSLSDWKGFLYYMVDRLRGEFVLRMDWPEQHWLPGKAFPKKVAGPGREKAQKSDYDWPVAKGSGNETNAVKALTHGLGLDPSETEGRHIINETLEAAWNAMQPLISSGGSYALDMKLAEIEQVKQAWKCPRSRRLVPRLLFGRSPNMATFPVAENEAKPVPVDLPKLPMVFPQINNERAEIQKFAQADADVAKLREEGLWTYQHDRIAIGAPFVRAEEHSAQQPPSRLRGFERHFKRGEINMLACSTTMEMGVDIGSIEAVINSNVPPSIANYRQRVGRAGRRRQGFAFSLTIARDTPLDRETLRDPLGYLNRELGAPKVTLESRPIVQRHANALLLAHWLGLEGSELHRINSGDFFGCRSDLKAAEQDLPSPCTRFVKWLQQPSTATRMQSKVKKLVHNTVLEGDPQIFINAAKGFEEEEKKFFSMWERLAEQVEGLESATQNRMRYQAQRLCGEYLLKELGNRALIPSSGFPTSVVPFVNDCAFMKDLHRAAKNDGDEITRGNRFDYPSRNADIAIREYAPGAQVVVDGLVWTSAGVTLNWKRPADDNDLHESQLLKWQWSCNNCGEHGSEHTQQSECPACGNASPENTEFLEPAGFRVAWSAQPHADTDNAKYIEPEDPKVSASDGDWNPLLDPEVGRYRLSATGSVSHMSQGPVKSRYDLCLYCGRAEPSSLLGADPLADHDALTPMKGESGRCEGNDAPHAIRRGIAFGHDVQTDVAELQLAGVTETGTAFAIASALREVLCKEIGIETRALGIAVQQRNISSAQPAKSMMLFDQASGGAGYASRAFEDIVGLLKEARNVLDCDAKCESACSSCVLAPDLFAKQEIMDRRSAHDKINDVLQMVVDPDTNDRAFDDSALSVPVADALVQRMTSLEKITIVADNAFDLSALQEEPLRSLLQKADRYGVKRALLLPAKFLENTDIAFRQGLQKMAHRYEFEILNGSANLASNGAVCIASAEDKNGKVSAYYSRDTKAAAISSHWGKGQDFPVICTQQAGTISSSEFSSDLFAALQTPHSSVASYPGEQQYLARQIGQKIVSEQLQPLLEDIGMWRSGELIEMAYSDRYLKAPLPMLCAFRSFSELAKQLGKGEDPTVLTLTCDKATNDRYPGRIFHNWADFNTQNDVAYEFAEKLELTLKIFDEKAPHARKLTLKFDGGVQVSCYFDQGFGAWQALGNSKFDFRTAPSLQAKNMLEFQASLKTKTEQYIAVRVE